MSTTSRRQPPPNPRTRRSAPLPRKRVEEALRESEKKYRTLTENIAVGIFRSTPGPRGAFLEVNPALVRMLGYRTKKELLAIEVAEIYQNPEDRLTFSEKLSRHGILKYQELNIRKKDGTPITVAETAIAVRDRKGKILYFDGIVEDITERKKASEEILIQKTYLEELFNSAPEAIILHDTTDRVLNVNDEFVTMFGIHAKSRWEDTSTTSLPRRRSAMRRQCFPTL
jgi:two-component system, cell cycle sensor histidine kinase and response regulator CckA